MTHPVKTAIEDDAKVRRLARRLGCWDAIADSIERGKSGVAVYRDWIFGYFSDGLIALEVPDPIHRTQLLLQLAAKIQPTRESGR